MKNRLRQSAFIALLYIVTAMFSLTLTSCEEGGINSQIVGGLKLGTSAQKAYAVTATAPRDIKFTVNSNTPWSVTSNQTWCVPTPVSSTVSALIQEVTVAMEKNEALTPRVAVLTILGEGVEKQEITITQDSKGALEVAMFETEVLFQRAGEGRAFTIVSNKEWTASSDKVWLTLSATSGAGSDQVNTITATAAENTANIRKAILTVKNGLDEQIFEITQDGNQLEVANITDTLFASGVDTKTYQVNANMPWTAEVMPGSEWVRITSDKAGNGNAELVVEVEPNPIFIERHGQVKLKPATAIPGLENVIIHVVQRTNFGADAGAEGSSITYDEKGAATFTTTGKRARVSTSQIYKLGIYEWKFASVNIPEGSGAYFDINAWPNGGDSPSSANYHIFLKNVKPTFSIGGGFKWDWADDKINLGDRKLNNMKKLTLKLEHDPGNVGKIRFALYFNDELILERKNLTNVYADPAEKGTPFYFGFDGGGAGAFTIESFTSIPIE